jgi:predicted  nucleic acid-binding Zn-ribbon protein
VVRARADDRGPALKAAPIDQLRLLDLQGLDTRLDQLAHRRSTLPEHAEISRLDGDLSRLRDLVVAADTQRSDVERQQAKADADVEQVRQRSARDQQRLDSGAVSSAKDLENLQHEIESLARRQSELEDVELEIMERLEEIQQRLADLTAQQADVTRRRDEVVARRDAALAEIDAEAGTTTEMRRILSTQIAEPLVTLYEKVRVQGQGTGAAALQHRRCQGCRLELNTTDMNRIKAAAEDEVLRCEECRRILVRTPESGLS